MSPQPKPIRALVLVTDAFGGKGGIAKFNRDLLTSLARMPECAEIIALPRLIQGDMEPVPPPLRFLTASSRGKLAYALVAAAQLLRGRIDLVVSAHINLAPLAIFLSTLAGAKSILCIHGIDAWMPHRSAQVRRTVQKFDRVVSVSQTTVARFREWSRIESTRMRILPNCVQLETYGPGPKSAALVQKLGIAGRTVVMTLGRLVSQERSKGFDEVIEALPALRRKIPGIVYLICGEGPDRHRLEMRARNLSVQDLVVFTGFVPEAEKADYYRLADAYVMPSRGEGFGIVLLEAMACGIPAMGSRMDGSREALLDGRLGILVDPSDSSDVCDGILRTLARGKGVPPELKCHFSLQRFEETVAAIVAEVVWKT